MLSDPLLSQIKELSKDFSKEQKIWLSGYFHGLSETTSQSTEIKAIKNNTSTTPKKISLLYGTETGNSKKLATSFATKLKKNGLSVKLTDIAQYKLKDLPKEELILVVISTQGEGEPPATAKAFYDYLKNESLDLSKTEFAVLALGDSSYPQFCKIGEDVHTFLLKAGAQKMAELMTCDTDYEEDAEVWINQIIQLLKNNNETATSEIKIKPPKKGKTIYHGIISNHINLNDSASDKETYHIEIETEESIDYLPGDALGVLPKNDETKVDQIIKLGGLDAELPIRTSRKTGIIRDLLIEDLNFNYLSSDQVEDYSKLIDKVLPKERASLLYLLENYPKPEPKKLVEFIEKITPITPRLYSISSSLASHGENEIHITVAKNEFLANDAPHTGLCSGFLSDKNEANIIEFYIHKNNNFRLPSEDKDVIMIGPGTGIAPFRSFLWERDAQAAAGKNWLFFGDRHFVTDFLYQTEIQDLLETGSLTRLDLAFSRDSKNKYYVQDRMRENAEELFRWVDGGAHLYICGTKEPMSQQVEETLVEIIKKTKNYSNKEAKNYLLNLENEGRYAKDVY